MATFKDFKAPIVDLDLSAPAAERWKKVGKRTSDHVNGALAKFSGFVDDFLPNFPQPSRWVIGKLINATGRVVEAIAGTLFGQAYIKEI